MTLSPIDYGGIDHPDADNSEAVRSCLVDAAKKGLTVADPRVWSVAGTTDVNLPIGRIHVGQLRLRQIDGGAHNCRTLMVRGGVRLDTESIEIDRGTNGKGGAMADAAGLWLAEGEGHTLKGVEIFGASKGQCLMVTATSKVLIDAPHIHDASFDEPTADDDRLQAIVLSRSNDVTVSKARIYRMTGNIPGKPLRYTRGIAAGECFKVSIDDPHIEQCDEAVDLTGSNNRLITVNGGHIDRVDSWGVKCANSALFCKVLGVTGSNCGMAAFVCSAGKHPDLIHTQGVLFDACTAIDPGGTIPGGVAVGFFIIKGDADPTFPRRITIQGSRAFDLREKRIMTYAFCNQVPGGGSRLINPEAFGWTKAKSYGFPA